MAFLKEEHYELAVDREKGTGGLSAVSPDWIASDVCLWGCMVSTALHDVKPEAWQSDVWLTVHRNSVWIRKTN